MLYTSRNYSSILVSFWRTGNCISFTASSLQKWETVIPSNLQQLMLRSYLSIGENSTIEPMQSAGTINYVLLFWGIYYNYYLNENKAANCQIEIKSWPHDLR